MATSFAALEAIANTAVFKRLANASTILGGVAVDGIFENAFELAHVGVAGMTGAAPCFTLATNDVPVNVVGVALVVKGIAYTVVEHHPDGVGGSLLQLEAA